MKCTNCGTQNADDARHCRHCGAVLPVSAEITQPGQMKYTDANSTHPLGDMLSDPAHTRPLDDQIESQATQPVATLQTAGVTRPLTRSRMFFEPLPQRALLADDRYRIRDLIEESPMLNIYSAVSRQALVECRACGYARNHYGDQFCLRCGTSLSNLEPHYPNLIIKETLAPDAIASERKLAELDLHHGGALLPNDTFTEAILGTQRTYVAMPEPSPFSAGHIDSSPEITDVVNWGVQLADALAYLHKHGVTFGAVDLDHISISSNAARWFNFSAARVQPPGLRNRQAYTDDVVALAANLFVLLTGQSYSPNIPIAPPGLADTFQAVFTGKLVAAERLADRLREVINEIRRPASYDLRVGRLSDVGQVRQINEDSLLTLEAGLVHLSIGSPFGLYVVADGMGGQMAADVASGLAIYTLAQHSAQTLLLPKLNQEAPEFDVDAWLHDAVDLANGAVHQQRQAAGTNMGTTLVMAVVIGGEAHVANVGDSRAYLINAAGIKQLTVDHSLVQRLIEANQLTEEEARTHPQRHVIYKNLGDRPKVEPDIIRIGLEPGDNLLLCSDGLSGYVEATKIHQIVMSASSPQEACRGLIDAANDNGGSDNITAVIVQMETLG